MAPLGSGHWEAIVRCIPCGCLVVDPQGIVRAINPSARRLLALESRAPLDQSVVDAVPAWHHTPLAQALPTLCAAPPSGEPVVFDLPAPHERCLRVYVSALTTTPGEPQGLVLTLCDITELTRLKRRLHLAEYQASVGKLARGIAHELNNPLDGVLRYTHLALEQLTEDTPVRDYLVHVKEGLDRMVRAVRAFLEFSRQAAAPANRTADLNSLIEDVLLLVHHNAKFQQIRIVKQFEEALPPVVDGGIQYAIANVIKNAFGAMPRGGMLTISTRRDDGHVEVEMADTGSGIPAEIQPRIFDPFFSTKPIHQGVGLGLLIAKEVVERSGGSIAFTSTLGIGTTFQIRVPIAGAWVSHTGATHTGASHCNGA